MSNYKAGAVSSAEVGKVVALIVRAERQLLKAVAEYPSEELVPDLSGVLRDLAAARLALERPHQSDDRRFPRVHETAMACLLLDGGLTVQVEVVDMSVGGALIASEQSLGVTSSCRLEIDGVPSLISAAIRPAGPGQFHLLFEGLTPENRLQLTKHLERVYLRA